MKFLKTAKKRATLYPAFPLLSVYPEETVIRRDTRTPTFTEALFTIAKTQKPAKCPPTDEWMKKDVVHIYNGLLLGLKKNEIMPLAATWMDLGGSYTE